MAAKNLKDDGRRGAALRQLRRSLGVTQEAVAFSLSKSRVWLVLVEQGRIRATDAKVRQISTAIQRLADDARIRNRARIIRFDDLIQIVQ